MSTVSVFSGDLVLGSFVREPIATLLSRGHPLPLHTPCRPSCESELAASQVPPGVPSSATGSFRPLGADCAVPPAVPSPCRTGARLRRRMLPFSHARPPHTD